MLRGPEIWSVLVERLTPGEWTNIRQIYDLVERSVELDDEDLEPDYSGSSSPRWRRNVRNVLQDRKSDGQIEWDRSSASYRLPIRNGHGDQIGETVATPWRSPDEDQTYEEGGSTRVVVNRYERDPRVRRACIKHWGYRCAVCEFDFEAVYGKLGKQFIHVRHLDPLASAGESRTVDPVKDLRPVCPNCHAMLHKGKPLLTINGLRSRLRRTSGVGTRVNPMGGHPDAHVQDP